MKLAVSLRVVSPIDGTVRGIRGVRARVEVKSSETL